MIVKSYAKINVSLQNVGKREDGYHLVDMVMIPVDLHDVIEIEVMPNGTPDTYITCDDIRLMAMKGNLCTRAVYAMKERYGFKEQFVIRIHKNIPFAAGLGGGSSNAAVVMKAVNQMLKLHATNDELRAIAIKLGADIPFFIDPKPCRVTGIGEELKPIHPKKSFYCVLVKPEEGLSTRDVYERCDEFEKENIHNDLVVEGLEAGDLNEVNANRGNDLYVAACAILPKVKEIVDSLRKDGFVAAMSGSGSSCFGLTEDKQKALEAEKRYKKAGYVVRLCKTVK